MHSESAKVSGDIDRHDAVVVGAGSAGLAAAAALQKRGFETVVLESSDAVGARWRSRYEELRLNSWRAMSNLRGYRMPRSCGRYPGRDDFVAYLERYVAHHRLRVRFHTKLVRVERAGDLWRLETSTQAMLARYVVIATGWDAVAVLPDWPGRDSFVPELIHSSDFRSGRRYADRNVLVVGFGNSGIDIAGHLIAAGARVRVSMRTPPNLAGREILVVVWDNLGAHVSRVMADLIAARDWLTVCQLPPYAHELNPVEPVWSHLKRSLANLAKRNISPADRAGEDPAQTDAVPARPPRRLPRRHRLDLTPFCNSRH